MKKLLWILAFCVTYGLIYGEGKVIVLCYHTFLSKTHLGTDFSPADFARHMKAIKDLGYHFVSYQDILSYNVYGDNNVLITIDDGNNSISNIDPILKEYGIKPMFFIYPNIIGKVTWAFNFNQLRAYEKAGVSFGGHGYFHLFVNQKLYKENKTYFNMEIYLCKTNLDKELSNKMTAYAYPFGDWSPVTKTNLKAAGFLYAFSLSNDFLRVPLELNPDLYDLPRYMVTKSSWRGIYQIMKNNVTEKKADSSEFPQTILARYWKTAYYKRHYGLLRWIEQEDRFDSFFNQEKPQSENDDV